MYDRIILADLHLEESPLTEYRWEVFPWIYELCSKYDIDLVDILGDITDKKDKHSAVLTNRLIESFSELADYGDVRILKGNHDYIDEKIPYFKFLKNLKGVKFFTEASVSRNTLFIPHTKNFNMMDYLKFFKDGVIDTIYMHQMFKGSVMQNNYVAENGIDTFNVWDTLKKYSADVSFIFSGDIHTPQTINNITYIGAPYHITFGDAYRGRCLVIKNNKFIPEYLDTVKRFYFHLNSDFSDKDFNELRKNDQVKVKIELKLHETYEWDKIRNKIKDIINKYKAIPISIEMKLMKEVNTDITKEIKEKTDIEILESFAKKENIESSFIDIAKGLMV